MARKISEETRELIRQFELLAGRFDAIANEGDLNLANEKLLSQKAFACNLIIRHGLHGEHRVHDPPNCFSHSKDPVLNKLYYERNELGRWWDFWVHMVMQQHAKCLSWNAGLPRRQDKNGETYHDAHGLGRQHAQIQAMSQGEFCRWFAWLLKDLSPEQAKQLVRRDEPTPQEIEQVRQLFMQNPEAQLKDIKKIISNSNKAQKAREIMRSEGLDQSHPRKRRSD